MFVQNPLDIGTADTKNYFRRAIKSCVGVGRKFRCNEVARLTNIPDDTIYSYTRSESDKHPEPENLYKLLTALDDDFASSYLAGAGLQAFKIQDTHITKYELTHYLVKLIAEITGEDPDEKNQHVNSKIQETMREAGRAIATFLATNN